MNATNVAQQGKRIVTLDIETISTDPNDPRGALGNGGDDAAPGEKSQIICIGMLIEQDGYLQPVMIADQDERAVLRKFWETVRADDLLVGHFFREFDIMRIKQRSCILDVEPSFEPNLAKYRETQVYDVMEQWTNWGQYKGATLDNLARALGVGRKNGHGAEVEDLWRRGEFSKLLDYCMNDVYLTYRVFCRMKFRPALPLALPRNTEAANEAERHEPFQAFRPAPVRDPNAVPRPISELRPHPASVPAASARQARPVAVAERPGPISASGRYRYVNDGNGGMRQLPVEPPTSSAEGGAEMMTPSSRASATPSVETNHKRSSRKRVYFVDAGGALTLTGATFPIKEELKAIGARMVWDEAAHKLLHWSIEAAKFDRLAGICARAGIALAAGRENVA